MNRLIRRSALPTLLCFMLFPAGCQWKGGPRPRHASDDRRHDREQVVWEVRPTSMRVYPSSGFRVIAGQLALEARIELLDDMGDSIKGVGTVRFEIYPIVGPERSDVVERIYGWDIEMLTLEKNREHYDSVTRTYLFQLHIPQPLDPGKPVRFVAEFVSADAKGKRLTADMVLQ